MRSTNENRSMGQGGQMDKSLLRSLMENELKDIYWAEKALTKALTKMAKKSTSQDLADALNSHLAETAEHIEKIEQVFDMIGTKAVGKKCLAMEGLIDEADLLMDETEEGPQRDAAIISAAQKIEHYEIASYGTLSSFAHTLGLMKAVSLLEEILEQEKNADATLTEIAVSVINIEALHEEEAEEE